VRKSGSRDIQLLTSLYREETSELGTPKKFWAVREKGRLRGGNLFKGHRPTERPTKTPHGGGLRKHF